MRRCGFWEKGCPADAHDAGRGCDDAASGKKEAQLMLRMPSVGAASEKKEAQLMLMMLGGCGFWEKGRPS